MAYNKDSQAKARIIARIRLCEIGGKPTSDLHPIGDGVSELRFNFGPGYRVYFAQKGSIVMLLLAGGDKSSQSKDIQHAKALLMQLIKEQQW